ncbi:hypothetical protein GW17_00062451 [Ensete ventricosum]|nr:hypothetical protein GW17_00062451 [Ensete ventricosum]
MSLVRAAERAVRRGGNRMKWSLTIMPLAAALAFSAPACATDTMRGHHACATGGKKGDCMAHHSMEHHYTGHHACASGGKKGGCMVHHPMGHTATPSGDKNSGDMK